MPNTAYAVYTNFGFQPNDSTFRIKIVANRMGITDISERLNEFKTSEMEKVWFLTTEKQTTEYNKHLVLKWQLIEHNGIIVNVASYINSVNDVMTEQGYTIISSDTNSIGDYGNAIVVTLIFENTKN